MPTGSDAVINNMHVDDFVIIFTNVTEEKEAVKETIAINSAASFRFRNFLSNDKLLQAALRGEDNATN